MNTKQPSSASSQENLLGTGELSPIPNLSAVGHSEIELRIAHERLRQARRSFDLAWFTTAACAVVGIGGVMLMMAGQPITGGAATAGGVGTTVYCLRLAKDANDRLDKVAKDLKEDD
jgi:hypothetical protein